MSQGESNDAEKDSGSLKEGLSESAGDPRVHLVMNLLLSAMFVYTLLWGLDFLGTLEFTRLRFAFGTVVMMGLTRTLI
ncbi:uncharacterized protein NP_1824A [Natronomonas pharaonis DSM 2160]|uniref:DUF8107 domain-containing protein n=1 Tax=Natronomonas pharaonis (strain ATCC 35678 / DSM 2160 / CIP 103997 / JCM 8858 / NBRC 14720 / NCIMB 2260 / Gabara) TaxID=348780 RepID=A0A1U7EVG5_NATPD|nr:hypothetical protein [Natronomonas pharaonis]CAI49003.1 uncharacterized protein NP_1824A [Natronomonas pharaonis DSM 2160]